LALIDSAFIVTFTVSSSLLAREMERFGGVDTFDLIVDQDAS